MKFYQQRLLSLFMALVMLFSFSVPAFAAAEPESICAPVNEYVAVQPASLSSDYGQLLNYSGTSDEHTIYRTFEVPSGGAYLYFTLNTNSPADVSMKKDNNTVWSRYCPMSFGQSKTYQIVFDYSPQDSYWAGGLYTLVLDIRARNVAYAFSVFASPYKLDI